MAASIHNAMDTLTHIAIGACIGEAFCGKQLGKRALLMGAIAQSVPDLDFLAALWMSPAENLLAHRGFTHSLLFVAAVTPLLALISDRLHRPHNISIRTWVLMFGIQGLVHIFLDGFNVYGVGWLEPFSQHRYSFNTLFVVDPFFSVWPFIAFIALLVVRRGPGTRTLWWVSGLLATSAYLSYAGFNKVRIDQDVKEAIQENRINAIDYFSTPTPFNTLLWYVVIRDSEGCHAGYRSVFDTGEINDFHFFPRNDSLLATVADHESLQHLIRFSKGYYTAERWGDTLVFNDLRFGQIVGWTNPEGRFAFHYFLSHGADNKLVVQRGRFKKWNAATVMALLRRIEGD